MIDSEKVIKGLECCVNDLGECEVCPYDERNGKLACGKNHYSDALALLKAQEPRVMTLEEVLALPYDTPIYIENCNGLYGGWDIFSGTTMDDNNDVVTGASWATAEYWSQDEYGDTWRCWTARPDRETREATPWN